jgi:hypothetical protein
MISGDVLKYRNGFLIEERYKTRLNGSSIVPLTLPLTELAQKTQVLFFTHHQHLVNIARDSLGGSVHVINL